MENTQYSGLRKSYLVRIIAKFLKIKIFPLLQRNIIDTPRKKGNINQMKKYILGLFDKYLLGLATLVGCAFVTVTPAVAADYEYQLTIINNEVHPIRIMLLGEWNTNGTSGNCYEPLNDVSKLGNPIYIHTGNKFTLTFGRSNGRCDGEGGNFTIRFTMLDSHAEIFPENSEYDDFFGYDNEGRLGRIETASNEYGGIDKFTGRLSLYGKPEGRDATFYTYTTPRLRNESISPPPEVVMKGQWERISQCDGITCREISMSITVGVDKSYGITNATASSESLSLMVGAEVTASSGALPGGSVTAKYEVTGTMSQERSQEIARSFRQSTSKTLSVSCQPPAALWQWTSSLHFTMSSGPEQRIEAPSSIYKCTQPDDRPPMLNDISWSPK